MKPPAGPQLAAVSRIQLPETSAKGATPLPPSMSAPGQPSTTWQSLSLWLRLQLKGSKGARNGGRRAHCCHLLLCQPRLSRCQQMRKWEQHQALQQPVQEQQRQAKGWLGLLAWHPLPWQCTGLPHPHRHRHRPLHQQVHLQGCALQELACMWDYLRCAQLHAQPWTHRKP